MLKISIHQPFSKESEMFPSTEDQEPSSRDTRCQTGPKLPRPADGNSMATPDRPGITPCTNSTLSAPQLLSSERDKNQTHSSGSDSSNSVRVTPPDSSTTRSQNHGGTDITDTWISRTEMKFSTLSLKVTKRHQLTLVLTPPPRKAESNSRLTSIFSAL